MSDLVPFKPSAVERRASRAIQHLVSETGVARAEDEATAALTAGRISDLARVTRHGVIAATEIGFELELQARMVESPFLREGMARIAHSGMEGIRRQIEDLAERRP